ncbi:MAG: hypothetical protein ACQESE_00845 [Nanobdellota archaeon]
MKDLFGEKKHQNAEQKLLLEILKKLEELNERITDIENKKQETINTTADQQEEDIDFETGTHEKLLERQQLPESEHENEYIVLGAPKGKEKREESLQALQEDTLKEISKNRKYIIKEKILSHCLTSRTSPLELKKAFVDTYRYCSKATFYRYLNELEEEEKINYISINNKKYIYPLIQQTQ